MSFSVSHWSGRLGNNIQQVANCIMAAEKYKSGFKQQLDHDIISFRNGSPYNDWHFLVDGKIKLIHAKGKLQLNHGDAILRSAINGGGLAMLSRFVVGRHIAAGTLVTESEAIGSNDNDTTIPTSAAVKDYVDTNGGISLGVALALGG